MKLSDVLKGPMSVAKMTGAGIGFVVSVPLALPGFAFYLCGHAGRKCMGGEPERNLIGEVLIVLGRGLAEFPLKVAGHFLCAAGQEWDYLKVACSSHSVWEADVMEKDIQAPVQVTVDNGDNNNEMVDLGIKGKPIVNNCELRASGSIEPVVLGPSQSGSLDGEFQTHSSVKPR